MEEPGSTKYKLYRKKEREKKTKVAVEEWFITKAMLEGISPEWKKTMVSGRKGPAKEPIKKPHVDISS